MYLKNPLEAPDILGTPEPPSPVPVLKGKKGGKPGEPLTVLIRKLRENVFRKT